jgi:hypothetical protein
MVAAMSARGGGIVRGVGIGIVAAMSSAGGFLRRGGGAGGGTDFRRTMRRARAADTDGRLVVGSRSLATSFEKRSRGSISDRGVKGSGTPYLRKPPHSAPLSIT